MVGLAYVVGLAVALPIGALQAIRHNKPVDYVLTGGSLVAYSMPTFWLGLLTILIFAVKLRAACRGAAGRDDQRDAQRPEGPDPAGPDAGGRNGRGVQPVLRASALEVLIQDYVRTARGRACPSAGC